MAARILFIVTLTALHAYGCGGPEVRRSQLGESCARTADCVAPARCIDNACVASGADRPAGQRGFETVEDLARATVEAVRTQSMEKLRALLVTEVEVEAAAKAIGLSEEKTAELVADIRGRLERFVYRYQRLDRNIQRLGVTPSGLSYAGVAPFRTTTEAGVERIDGDVDVLVRYDGHERFKIDIEDCIKTPTGWLLADPEVELEAR